MRRALAALLGLLLASCGEQAEPPARHAWTTAVMSADAAPFAGVGLVPGPGGTGVTIAAAFAGSSRDDRCSAFRTVAATFSGERTRPASYISGSLETRPVRVSSNLVAVLVGCERRATLELREFGFESSAAVHRQRIARSRGDLVGHALVSDGRGTVAAIWSERVGDRERLLGRIVSPRARRTPVFAIATGHVSSAAATFVGGERLAVAYANGVRVLVREVSSDASVSRPEDVGAAAPTTHVEAATIDDHATIAWETADESFGVTDDGLTAYRVYVSTPRPDRGRKTLRLESSRTAIPAKPVRLVVSQTGRALLAWGIVRSHPDGARPAVHVAQLSQDGSWSTPREVTSAGDFREAALNASGRALIVWDANGHLAGAVRRPDGAFVSVRISDSAQAEAVAAAVAADGTLRAAWLNNKGAERPGELRLSTASS